jgi:hypothetical protein
MVDDCDYKSSKRSRVVKHIKEEHTEEERINSLINRSVPWDGEC